MTATPRPTLRHVPALDGLRGLAVAAVVAFHAGLGWATGGYLGVSAFFTLSGYLITSLLLVEWDATGAVSLGSFWSRRFRRLLPAALAVIAGVVVVAPFLADASQLEDLLGDAASGLGYVANWRFVLEDRSYGELFAGPSPLQHLWSLAIEEQFYVVFPLVTVGLLRAGRGRRVLLAGAFSLLTVGSMAWMWQLGDTASGITRSYYDTGARAAELLLGALLAVLLAGRPERVERRARIVAAAGAAALVALVVAWVSVPQASTALRHGGFALHAALMCAVLAAAHVPGPVRAVCSIAPLRLAGRVSYGIYLFHWPVFVWLDAERAGTDGIPLLAMQLGLTALLTAISYRLVEQPIRLGSAWRGRQGIAGALAGAAAVVIVTVGVTTWAQPARPDLSVLDGLQVAHTPPAIDDSEAGPETHFDARAATAAPVEVVDKVLLVGDSVMSQAYDHHAARFGSAGVTTAYAGGPSSGPLSPQGGWAGQLDAWVPSFQPDVVVIEACCNYTFEPDQRYVDGAGTSVAPGSDAVLPAWEAEIRDLVRRARAGGARVALVRFAPVQTNGFYGPIEEHVAAVNALYDRLVQEDPSIELVDWGPVLAPGGQFQREVPGSDGAPVRVRLDDGVHLTPSGSDLVAAATVDAVLGR
jgi:peptidoglycan/LPS O-acetylase OafA/YrhL/lysophospholipase L1-like esterase